MSWCRLRSYVACALAIGFAVSTTAGCDSIDGRSKTRLGNRLFREARYKAAIGTYETALTKVDDPIIKFNLALDEQKVFTGGIDEPIVLGTADSTTCALTAKVKPVTKQVCAKEDDERFDPCDAKNICPSSATCQKVDLCEIAPKDLADLIADNFNAWLIAHPGDPYVLTGNGEKVDLRKVMVSAWLDSSQYAKALAYWQSLLDKKPNDPEIMGELAGINRAAGDWKGSIGWYTKLANVATDTNEKISSYQSIGNLGWAKLNSRSLAASDAIQLADLAADALRKAGELSPKNPKFPGLMGSIYNFRGMVQGSSFAAGIDRATAQELLRKSHVLTDEAKKAQGLDTSPAPTAPAPAGSAGSAEAVKTGG